MSPRREKVPASTRNLPLIIGLTAVVGVLVGVLYSSTGAGGILLFAGLYFVAVVLWIVPGQRQMTITDTLVEVRRTAGAKPEAQVAHQSLRLDKRGRLFSSWQVGDRGYSTPTARALPLFTVLDEQA